jgi:hypothetical protein
MKKILMILLIVSWPLHASFVQRITAISRLIAYYKSVEGKRIASITGINKDLRRPSLLYLLNFNHKKDCFFLKESLNLAETKERALVNYLIQQERDHNNLPEVIIFSDKDKQVVENVVKKVFQYDASIEVMGLHYDPADDLESENR